MSYTGFRAPMTPDTSDPELNGNRVGEKYNEVSMLLSVSAIADIKCCFRENYPNLARNSDTIPREIWFWIIKIIA